ncbi:ribosome small subunit-dependent GTPase A [Flavobacteriaceae bacterium]|jgi:ribosome biogenesis GTPase|nr:ribosome small subunit-dependent GTPase A [Flavobacteriaceae bacterium]MBT7574844.1 ribosome small subunit-dependent GTPase A [Flavobacteriaceae bacterium]MDA7731091.1 ribosome small subunit-dependent GTPase A [Flavobacteriaceae bacterium]MDA9828032.1 ribosome small subunit-dependent GTPase A [Flavobacteriaceae bacterium]
MKGLVYKSTGNWYDVHTDSKVVYKCNIKGKFRSLGIKSTNPVAVGDRVVFEVTDELDLKGLIVKIENRDNYIIRKSVNLSKQTQIIASNIDCCFLFVTPSNPQTSSLFIDRILVSTKSYGIETVILFNKTDIYSEKDDELINNLNNIYKTAGYKTLRISVKKGTNIDLVKSLMKNKVSVFTGHSGVGKSSLINNLDPSLNLRTSIISEQNEQGQHTTTFAEMFDLADGAKIIDSPGIKGFGLIDIDKNEIGGYFNEIAKLSQNCKFNNCLHNNEPSCAVKKAVDSNEISESRYNNYLSLLNSDDSNFRIDNYQ